MRVWPSTGRAPPRTGGAKARWPSAPFGCGGSGLAGEGFVPAETSVRAAVGACPDVVASILLMGAEQDVGAPLPAEQVACVHEQVRARAEAAAEALVTGGPGAEALGMEIAAACRSAGG